MKCNLSRVFLAAVIATAVGSPLAVGEREQPQEKQRLPLVKYVEPSYPTALRLRGVTNGYALVFVTVDRTGRLLDAYATEFSHRKFADSALEAINRWTFEEDAAATPVPRLYPIRFNYLVDGLVLIVLHANDMVGQTDRFGRQKPASKSVPFHDLDEFPREIHTPLPDYPEALKPERKAGSVEILFFVDNSGHVRVPSVTQMDDPLFAAAAIEAVQKWTFEPPTHRGKPVSAFSLHRFTFSPRSSSNG